jgi:hypothetical protein
MRPRLFAVAAVCCCLPVTVGAQIPKIKTPKVSVPGQSKEQQTTTAKPKCDISTVVVSNDVVSRYLKSLDARDAEIRSIAKENSAIGRYYAAVLKQQDEKRRWNDYQAGIGPDYAKEQEALKKAKGGDVNGYKVAVEVQRSVQPSDTKLPETSWEDQKAGNDRIDAAMQKAGDFEACDWTGVTDVIPPMAYAVAEDPNVKPSDLHIGRPTGVSADELAAVRAKRVELAKGLGISYKSDAQVKEGTSDRATKSTSVDTSPMAAYNLCISTEMKPSLDYTEAHKGEIEAAQKAGDYAKMAEISSKANDGMLAATNKCQPLMPH